MKCARLRLFRSIQFYLKLFLLLFYYTFTRLRIAGYVNKMTRARARACVYGWKKIHRATRWRFGDICPPLPADERQKYFKNSFPSTENIATGKKSAFYSASNYPASLILESRDRKWLEDYTMQISDYNVWLICANPHVFVRQRSEKSRRTIEK